MRIIVVVGLLLGCGGNAKPAIDLEDELRRAADERGDATPDQLDRSSSTLRSALESVPDDPRTLAQLERNAGLALLLYDHAIEAPGTKGEPGGIDHAVGRAAKLLATAKTAADVNAAIAVIDGAKPAGDPWLSWLRGRASVLLGDRAGARAAFEAAKLPIADIDRAYLLAADNKIDDAIKVASNTHPLATLARAAIRAEADTELAQAVEELKLVPTTPPGLGLRVESVWLVLSIANERFDVAAGSLKKLGGSKVTSSDCATWARIAFAYVQLGRAGEGGRSDFRAATVTRAKCPFGGAAPLLGVVDANLRLAIGDATMARVIGARFAHPWATVIEAQAALELGDAGGALAAVAKRVSRDANHATAFHIAEILSRQASALLTKKFTMVKSIEPYTQNATSQRARHALGAAYFAFGDLEAAKRELRRAVADTSETSPNPLAYRTRSLLAEIAIAQNDLDLAANEIALAVAIHEGNRHTKSIQALIALRGHDPEKALTQLSVLRKSGELPALAQLVVAEALVIRKEVSADERAQAKTLVTGLVGNPAIAPAELGRVAAIVDPKLPGELKLPVGKPAGKGA